MKRYIIECKLKSDNKGMNFLALRGVHAADVDTRGKHRNEWSQGKKNDIIIQESLLFVLSQVCNMKNK